eukprot:COSAG01_NODE_1476_length_10188_cov_16.029537_11_plen_86_part_00
MTFQVLVYPIGIPALLFSVLFLNRRELRKEDSDARDTFDPLVRRRRTHTTPAHPSPPTALSQQVDKCPLCGPNLQPAAGSRSGIV